MYTNENQYSNVLLNMNIHQAYNSGQNLLNDNLHGFRDLERLKEDYKFNNNFDPKEHDQITNDEDDFLNPDYPDDDDDLEEEAEDSIEQPGDDFEETEDFIEDPDYEEEDFPEDISGKF